ncbi:MAG: hypothetical protein AAGG53_09905 [Cyanobacteria bacterium P01_H01_bin.152]
MTRSLIVSPSGNGHDMHSGLRADTEQIRAIMGLLNRMFAATLALFFQNGCRLYRDLQSGQDSGVAKGKRQKEEGKR